jgi:hypothetical protein
VHVVQYLIWARANSRSVLGSTEQLIVTSIKHEDGSPPTNIIKKEPTPSSSSGSGASTSSNVNSNDSNNNNDTNDNKNSNSSGNPLLPDEKVPSNDNSITDDCEFPEESPLVRPLTQALFPHFSAEQRRAQRIGQWKQFKLQQQTWNAYQE